MDGPLLASRGMKDNHRDRNNSNNHRNRNRDQNRSRNRNSIRNHHPSSNRSQSPHRHHHESRLSRSRSRSRSRDRHYQEQRNDDPSSRGTQAFRPKHSNNNNNKSRNHNLRNGASFTTNKVDPELPKVDDDPRSSDPSKRISHKALSQTKGRNTESFHAESTLVRPDLRVQIGSPAIESYNKKLKHDDVVIVPELFGAEDDWSTYYKLVEEMRDVQEREKNQQEGRMENGNRDNNNNRNGRRSRGGGGGKSEWIPWHEGAHLISKKPDDSPTYQSIIKRLCTYFNIDTNKQIGTRFNWYRDSNDWKPFHHDSAAFNPSRAKNQNITIGVSFGAMRELAFIRTKPYANSGNSEDASENKCRLYFPQNNNGVFSFGRDANIHWKHGINALPPSEHDGKGRISIILWGYVKNVIEEEDSPPLLGSDGKGPHAGGGGNRGRFSHDRRNAGRGRGDGRRGHHHNHYGNRQD